MRLLEARAADSEPQGVLDGLKLHLWDTPTPPLLDECSFFDPLKFMPMAPSSRFYTVDLNTVTGLTFFFGGSLLLGVHAHTPSAPTATRTAERISLTCLDVNLVWIYLPISSNDRITALAMRVEYDERLAQPGNFVLVNPQFTVRRLALMFYVN